MAQFLEHNSWKRLSQKERMKYHRRLTKCDIPLLCEAPQWARAHMAALIPCVTVLVLLSFIAPLLLCGRRRNARAQKVKMD